MSVAIALIWNLLLRLLPIANFQLRGHSKFAIHAKNTNGAPFRSVRSCVFEESFSSLSPHSERGMHYTNKSIISLSLSDSRLKKIDYTE